MKKMNGDLMYSRIKKYADVCYGGGMVEDWKYKATGEDRDDILYGLSKVVELTQTIITQSGFSFDMVSILLVPYDGRKRVVLDKILD